MPAVVIGLRSVEYLTLRPDCKLHLMVVLFYLTWVVSSSKKISLFWLARDGIVAQKNQQMRQREHVSKVSDVMV